MRRFLLGIPVGILAPVLALLLIARLGLFPVHATEASPTWEVRLARMALAWREAMLPDKEAWEVVTFLSRLDTLPAAVQAAWKGDH
jgi:hypothetical protein